MPNRKTREQKIIDGSFSEHREPNKAEYETLDMSQEFKLVNDDAKAWADRNQYALERIGHIKASDYEWFTVTANLWARVRMLERLFFADDFKLITMSKTNYPVVSPVSSQLNQATQAYLKALREGGLTPISRGTVEVSVSAPVAGQKKPGERSRKLGAGSDAG